MIVIATITCLISGITIRSESAGRITATLNLACAKESSSLNSTLTLVQNDVNYIASEVMGNGFDLERLRNEESRRKFLGHENESLQILSNSIGDCVSYYLVLDPETIGEQDGFWYTRSNNTESFTSHELTDLSQYDPSDTEHVGWYYPVRDGGVPTWMNPYWNDNLDVYMISYVIPLFAGDTFVGVVGMDLNFKAMLADISTIHPYESAQTFVVCSNGHLFTSIDQASDSADADFATYQELYDSLAENSTGAAPVELDIDGQTREVVYTTLTNGMKLCLSISSSEFNGAVSSTFVRVMLALIVVFVVFGIVMSAVIGRIVRPLRDIMTATNQVAKGNMDIKLESDSNDEVGELTRSFQDSVLQLNEYVTHMQTEAYRDALTGVKNTTAYEAEVAAIDKEIAAGEDLEFGVVMGDMNDLKVVNDSFGHANGDIAIVNGCRLLCKVYKHSPVFRIGGDEFIVILRGSDYAKRSELRRQIEPFREMRDMNAEHPWEQASISCGFADYDPSIDNSFASVFHRADADMYASKRCVHNNVEPRDGNPDEEAGAPKSPADATDTASASDAADDPRRQEAKQATESDKADPSESGSSGQGSE